MTMTMTTVRGHDHDHCNDQVNWGEWNLPMRVCDFYLAMDVVCSTSSIFHLVAISIDR